MFYLSTQFLKLVENHW